MMHVVGIKKTLVERFPWLPATVYKAFCQAKDIAIREMAEHGGRAADASVAGSKSSGRLKI